MTPAPPPLRLNESPIVVRGSPVIPVSGIQVPLNLFAVVAELKYPSWTSMPSPFELALPWDSGAAAEFWRRVAAEFDQSTVVELWAQLLAVAAPSMNRAASCPFIRSLFMS